MKTARGTLKKQDSFYDAPKIVATKSDTTPKAAEKSPVLKQDKPLQYRSTALHVNLTSLALNPGSPDELKAQARALMFSFVKAPNFGLELKTRIITACLKQLTKRPDEDLIISLHAAILFATMDDSNDQTCVHLNNNIPQDIFNAFLENEQVCLKLAERSTQFLIKFFSPPEHTDSQL